MSNYVRKGVPNSLDIKADHISVNLGRWHPNLHYGVRVTQGGWDSYSEVCQFFDPNVAIEDTPQAIIFAESYQAVHYLADRLRTHFGLSGEMGRDLIPLCHSLLTEPTRRRNMRYFKQGKARILILFEDEAFTVDADLPSVKPVLNFSSPASLEIWIQRAELGAGLPTHRCPCVVLVAQSQVILAAQICKSAGVEVDPALLATKVEDPKDEEWDFTDDDEDYSGASRNMSLGMAKYIIAGVSGGCLTEPIDQQFSNPAHTSCFEVGGCENCHTRRYGEAKRDTHYENSQAVKTGGGDEDSSHDQIDAQIRSPAERQRFLDAILAWRRQKFIETCKIYDLCLEEIMTDKAAERVSKLKFIAVPSDFDKPEVNWPGHSNWRLELLVVLSELQRAEDLRAAVV
ncbi:hypothetical protein FRC09_001429 [Ceratobasidium sp. 395]|nr:hypothetical protein FRC09_001429 [Ceratobasidium sp. 395]